MQLSKLFNDEKAVSPVIGVILMVAITVILAAVIGTFVLGLGDSLGDNQPSAQLSASVSGEADTGTLVIEHDGGDSIPSDSIRVVIDDVDNSTTSEGTITERLSVGDRVSGDFGGTSEESPEELRVRLVHTPSDSILLDRTFEVDDIEMATAGEEGLTFD